MSGTDAGKRPDDQFEQFDRAVEHLVVAAILDDGAGVSHCGAVTREHATDIGQADAAGDVRQIHGDLPRQRDFGTTACLGVDRRRVDPEHLGDSDADGLWEAKAVRRPGHRAGPGRQLSARSAGGAGYRRFEDGWRHGLRHSWSGSAAVGNARSIGRRDGLRRQTYSGSERGG